MSSGHGKGKDLSYDYMSFSRSTASVLCSSSSSLLSWFKSFDFQLPPERLCFWGVLFVSAITEQYLSYGMWRKAVESDKEELISLEQIPNHGR